MKRVADSTIKGFIYQFNVTLEQILKTTQGKIQIEGVTEDIDIVQENHITAIQCKYHESIERYSLSAIRKPVLQMLKTESERARGNQISYILYAHFPDLDYGVQDFTKADLTEMLHTRDEKLIISYIAHIIDIESDDIRFLINKSTKSSEDKKKIKKYILDKKFNYEIKVSLDFFLEKFSFQVGEKIDDLQINICELLINSSKSFSEKDIMDIVYPNAIQLIANLSIKEDADRFVTRDSFLSTLEKIKSTAITRWTRELSTYRQLLIAMRNQLHSGLNRNYQDRLFLIKASNFDEFNEEVVTFLKDFCDLYTIKPQLHIPATFCILDCDKSKIDQLITRLFKVNIAVEDGFRGNEFFPESFFRKPMFDHKANEMEFRLRICSNNDNFMDALKRNKPEVIYCISNELPNGIETRDIRVEYIDTKTIQDLEYVLSIKKGM